ncbi:MAG: type VII toxin-antitoxin system MntA family adenylyltransferase antitoxin [Thermoplasmatota archaeon]
MVALADEVRAALEPLERVQFAYLFGSQAVGRVHPRSDVDVAVWLSRAGMADEGARGEIQGLLQWRLRRRDVDLVILNDAPLLLKVEAIRGALLLSRDEGARVEFEAGTMLRYHDRLPYLRRHLAQEGTHLMERGYA